MTVCDAQDWDVKGTKASSLLSLVDCLPWGSQLPYQGYIQAALCKASGKELRHAVASGGSEPARYGILQPRSSLQMTAALADSLSITSRETLSQNHAVKLPRFLSHRNCEIMNVGCFKPVNVGTICYMTLDDKYKHHSHKFQLCTVPLDKVQNP